jgi:hypothetical protein
MRVPRFTTRRLMIAAAILGVCLGLDGMGRRKAEYSSRAGYHATQYRERQGLLISGLWGMQCGRAMTLPDPFEAALIGYHREMAAKYEWASRHPWLPVAQDPPEPKDGP